MSGRPGMIERLGGAFASHDLSHRLYECDADRLGAVAFARPLGAELLRLRTVPSASPMRAAAILAKRMRRKARNAGRGYLLRIAGAALYEWMHRECHGCNGARLRRADSGTMKVCPTCGGSGVRRHSDTERARAMALPPGVAPSRPTTAAIDDALDFCGRAYSDALGTVRKQLRA